MTWDEIAAQAGVALLVVRDGAICHSNPAADGLVEPFGARSPSPVIRGTRPNPIRCRRTGNVLAGATISPP